MDKSKLINVTVGDGSTLEEITAFITERHGQLAYFARRTVVEVYWLGYALGLAKSKFTKEGEFRNYLATLPFSHTSAYQAIALHRAYTSEEDIAGLTITEAKLAANIIGPKKKATPEGDAKLAGPTDPTSPSSESGDVGRSIQSDVEEPSIKDRLADIANALLAVLEGATDDDLEDCQSLLLEICGMASNRLIMEAA